MSDPLNHLGSSWYHSEPLEVLYSPNQFLGWDFFAVSYNKPALKTKLNDICTRISNGTGQCNFSGQRDRSSFIVPGQRDKLKILPRDGMGRDSQNSGRDGPGQSKSWAGHGTKQDRAEKDVQKQENDVLKQKRCSITGKDALKQENVLFLNLKRKKNIAGTFYCVIG